MSLISTMLDSKGYAAGVHITQGAIFSQQEEVGMCTVPSWGEGPLVAGAPA